MSAGNYDLNLEEGADFSITLTITDSAGTAVDLTGHTAEMNFSSDRDTAYTLQLTHSAGLTMGGTAGTIVVALTDTQVGTLSAAWTKGQYDLITIDAAGLRTRRISGSVYIAEQVHQS